MRDKTETTQVTRCFSDGGGQRLARETVKLLPIPSAFEGDSLGGRGPRTSPRSEPANRPINTRGERGRRSLTTFSLYLISLVGEM